VVEDGPAVDLAEEVEAGPVVVAVLVALAEAAEAVEEPAAAGKIYWYGRICDRCFENRRIADT
jgi:hypothetical protein